MNHIITLPSAKQTTDTDSYEKGRLFEQYVIELFNKESFQLKKWRKSERITDRIYSPDHSNPDLELTLFGKKQYRFAVECKWRKEFKEGKIEWAANFQISSYENFQTRFRIPVFIAIGIGGEPSAPEKLFVTPLDNICNYTSVYESDLIPYKRKPTHKFFFDTVQLKLF